MSRSAQRFVGRLRRALLGACGYTSGARLIVGCSGGPDSTALLVGLCALQGDLDLSLHVVHVDHGLRPESAAEGAQVLALALGLDVPAESVRVTVAPGPSRMAEARRARYQALARLAQVQGAQAVAVGHTLNDQAETMLMRLLGGAGLCGLAGMAPRRELAPRLGGDAGQQGPGRDLGQDGPVLLIRPLLGMRREDVAAFLASAEILACEDPTNQDRRYQRSRLRHEMLPLLRRERGDLDGHLGELAALLRSDADYLDEQAEAALRQLLGGPLPAGEVLLPVVGLVALPRALSSRVIRRVLPQVSHRHVEDVLAMCRRTEGSAAIDLPGGRAERRYGVLHLRGTHAVTPTSLIPAAAPATVPQPVVPATVLHHAAQPTASQPAAQPTASQPAITVAIPAPGEYCLGDTAILLELRDAPPLESDREAPQAPRSTDREAQQAPRSIDPRRTACFDVQGVRFPLFLRPARPGDRIRVRGMSGHKKVSDLLIDDKVPRAERAAVVLLCQGPPDPGAGDDDEILWVAGHRAAETARPAPAGPVLVCRLL